MMFFVNDSLYYFFLFFFNDTATTEIYTLSLHDALPILLDPPRCEVGEVGGQVVVELTGDGVVVGLELVDEDWKSTRLNSSHANISYAVFCLKKKKKQKSIKI